MRNLEVSSVFSSAMYRSELSDCLLLVAYATVQVDYAIVGHFGFSAVRISLLITSTALSFLPDMHIELTCL